MAKAKARTQTKARATTRRAPARSASAYRRITEPGEVRRTEIVLEVEDRPGSLAEVGEILGEAKVNIVTAAVFTYNKKGMIRLVVEDLEAALAALKRAGIKVATVTEALAVTLDDRPGELGRFARSLADAGINISALYIAGERAGEKELIVAINSPQRVLRGRA